MEENEHDSQEKEFEEIIRRKQMRMMQAKNNSKDIWINFTTFGVIGWTIITPTVIGIALGTWIDHSFSPRHSWTLMLMSLGLILGLANSWRWIDNERKALEEETKEIEEQAKSIRPKEENQ